VEESNLNKSSKSWKPELLDLAVIDKKTPYHTHMHFFLDGRQQRCFNSLRENRAKAGRAQDTEGRRNEHTHTTT
jgi:hypothetical protein